MCMCLYIYIFDFGFFLQKNCFKKLKCFFFFKAFLNLTKHKQMTQKRNNKIK